jgi:hypothetical protein
LKPAAKNHILVILVEHQSTINPNMALRFLMYMARVYEKILGDKNIYTTKALVIPRPEFFVLYNGLAPYPDEDILRLSDLYEDPEQLGLEKALVEMELVVGVININQGRNEIVKRCRVLEGYSDFIGKVRDIEREGMKREKALESAIVYCREHDILKGVLEEHGTEVMNMLMAEWKQEDALAVRYREGRELGHEEGLKTGLERGLEKGLERGLEKVARNALVKGMSPDAISELTGLDSTAIKRLAGQ